MTEGNDVVKLIKRDLASLNKENKKEVLFKIKGYFSKFSSDFFERNFLFVYGTLRGGQDNYLKIKSLFGGKGIQYIYTTKFDYKCIHDLGTFPVLLDSKSPDFVIGDVVYVGAEAYNFIKEMEEEAGYVKEIANLWLQNPEDNHYKCLRLPCYVAGDNLNKQVRDDTLKYPKISSGDWVRYQGETEKIVVQETNEERVNRMMAMWEEDGSYYD